MINTNNPYRYNFSPYEINTALQRAKDYCTKSIDNLRNRHMNVKLDSAIRGFLGEMFIKAYFKEGGLELVGNNTFADDSGVDIDFTTRNENLDNINIEVKTSLIPDMVKSESADEVYKKIVNCFDIKIIKRCEKSFDETTTDIHIQIYYNRYARKRDEQLLSLGEDLINKNDEEIISLMELNKYAIYFTTWVDKKGVKNFLSNESVKTWSHAKREFWRAPIKIVGKNIEVLVDEIHKYLR